MFKHVFGIVCSFPNGLLNLNREQKKGINICTRWVILSNHSHSLHPLAELQVAGWGSARWCSGSQYIDQMKDITSWFKNHRN